MATHVACDFVGLKMIDDGSEVCEGIQGPPRKNGISAVVEHPERVEASKNVATGLVDDGDDQCSIVGHLFEQVHQQF